MKFSLIIGTINRREALECCLLSILNQTYQNYEIIIVDQSEDNETELYVKNILDNRVIYKHVKYTGLSKARNEALELASGDYFCLIDDDAYYDEKYLETASQYVAEKRILSGFIYDTINEKEFVKYKKNKNGKILNVRMILRTCPSAGLVIPMDIINEVGCFDEQFGAGAKYKCGEETDLLLRGLRKGYNVLYINELRLKHPFPVPTFEELKKVNSEKLISYYEGIGALIKKHRNGEFGLQLQLYYCELMTKNILKKIAGIDKTSGKKIKKLKWGFNNYILFL